MTLRHATSQPPISWPEMEKPSEVLQAVHELRRLLPKQPLNKGCCNNYSVEMPASGYLATFDPEHYQRLTGHSRAFFLSSIITFRRARLIRVW